MERENFGSNTENNIEFLRDAETATCSFSQGRYISKIRKLAEKYPDECEIVAENKDGSIVAHFPVKWIQITKREGREMTEEEKEAAAERLRLYRERKSGA
jgi:hypothetical protein